MLNVVVLVSGGGTNLQAILDRVSSGQLKNVNITGVIASRSDAYALERAGKSGIPSAVVSKKEHGSLEKFDEAMLAALQGFGAELVVLAGYLSLIGPLVCRAYEGCIINIHPSLIPSFCGPGFYGLKVHQAALAYGVKVTGATVHFVSEHYDEGAVIAQKAVDVLPDDTPQILQRRVMEQAEWELLPYVIGKIADGKVSVRGRTVTIDG